MYVLFELLRAAEQFVGVDCDQRWFVLSKRAGLASASLLVFLVSACAAFQKKVYTVDEMVVELDRRVSPEVRDRIVVPFETDDEIRGIAREITKGLTRDSEKARAIAGNIISVTGLSFSYDWLSNKTAREVFRQGQGNCLAYTNLFVGMAREAGLKAVYVDVVTTERISRVAEVIVNSGHITAGVYYGTESEIVDFARTPERQYIGCKVIGDLEAIANYYNNQGFLYGHFTESDGRDLGFDPMERELEMYEVALEVLPTFHRARNNLGVALKRAGQIEEAIEQYELAIESEPNFAEAHFNLGSAYHSQGRTEEAIKEFRIAAESSDSNAYLSHQLGIVQFQLERYDEAVEQFKRALSKDPQLADARYYLGECYLKLGDEKRAIKEYEATLELDPDYLSARAKLEMLSPLDASTS
jgi:hypothetical protein